MQKQSEINKKIATRIQNAAMNKYDRILQKLGVDNIVRDPGAFVGSQLQSDWGKDDADPTRRQKAVFRYRDDTKLPDAAIQKRKEKENVEQARVPALMLRRLTKSGTQVKMSSEIDN